MELRMGKTVSQATYLSPLRLDSHGDVFHSRAKVISFQVSASWSHRLDIYHLHGACLYLSNLYSSQGIARGGICQNCREVGQLALSYQQQYLNGREGIKYNVRENCLSKVCMEDFKITFELILHSNANNVLVN